MWCPRNIGASLAYLDVAELPAKECEGDRCAEERDKHRRWPRCHPSPEEIQDCEDPDPRHERNEAEQLETDVVGRTDVGTDFRVALLPTLRGRGGLVCQMLATSFYLIMAHSRPPELPNLRRGGRIRRTRPVGGRQTRQRGRPAVSERTNANHAAQAMCEPDTLG